LQFRGDQDFSWFEGCIAFGGSTRQFLRARLGGKGRNTMDLDTTIDWLTIISIVTGALFVLLLVISKARKKGK